MKKRYIIPVFILALFFLGPKANYPSFDAKLITVDIPLEKLDNKIASQEAEITNLKPDNQSRIKWANDSIGKTEYAVVYLHGFSASPKEGDPIHTDFCKRYGMNLYVPRLAGHGIQDDDAFKELTPKDLIDSAKEAIAIGKLLGEKVILMSCSTGSTLSLFLASENPTAIHSLFMYSPNIDLYAETSDMLTMPWGKQLAKILIGEHRTIPSFKGTELEKYWTTTYNTQGIISLKYLVENTMTESILSKIKQPYLLGYYYKNEEAFDKVVSIEKMKWFNTISTTPAAQKRLIAFPNVDAHVMTCKLQSKDLESVRNETYEFAEEVLGLSPL